MDENAEDWRDLQQAWQAQSDPDAAALRTAWTRVAYASRLAQLRTALDIAGCAVGASVGAWALQQSTPSSITAGVAALAFAAFGGWLVWSNARVRHQAATGSIIEALDAAISLERAAENWTRTLATMSVAATVFLAIVAFVVAADSNASPKQLRHMLEAIGIALLCLSIASSVSQRFAARAQCRRYELERRRAEFAPEPERIPGRTGLY
jgi:hypothetical protein